MKLVLNEKIDTEYEAVFGKNYIKITSPSTAEVFVYRQHTTPLIIGVEGYKNKITFENSDNNRYFEIPWSGKSFLEEPSDTIFMIKHAMSKHSGELFEGFSKRINEKLSFDELRDLEKKLNPYLKNIWVHEVHFENMKHLEGEDINLLLYADVDGDWKHDHLAYQDAVKEFCCDTGFDIVSHRQKEIGHSDSDSYEAEHIFWIRKDAPLTEKVNNQKFIDLEKELDDELDGIGVDFLTVRQVYGAEHSPCDFVINADIRGDWKHDHLAFTQVIEDFCKKHNFDVVDVTKYLIDDDNMSDYYSAQYNYYVNEKLQENYGKKLYKRYRQNESVNYYNGEVRLSEKQRKVLNRVCRQYCGWKLPKEIAPLWDELSQFGIDPITIEGYPDQIAEDGGKSWSVPFSMDGQLVTNSRFIYQVYEGQNSLKNEYNIYFS